MQLKYKDWTKISIKKYNQIVDILEKYKDKQEKQIIPILSLLYDVSEKEIGNLKIYDVSKLISEVSFINEFSFDKENRIDEIIINDINCKVKYDLSDFSYKQFLDYQETFKKLETDRTYLPNVIATFLLPENKKYDTDYELQKFIDDIEEYMPITTAQNLMYFFQISSLKLLKLTKTSLEGKQMKKMIMKKKLNKK